jgi:hypothetical protein
MASIESAIACGPAACSRLCVVMAAQPECTLSMMVYDSLSHCPSIVQVCGGHGRCLGTMSTYCECNTGYKGAAALQPVGAASGGTYHLGAGVCSHPARWHRAVLVCGTVTKTVSTAGAAVQPSACCQAPKQVAPQHRWLVTASRYALLCRSLTCHHDVPSCCFPGEHLPQCQPFAVK